MRNIGTVGGIEDDTEMGDGGTTIIGDGGTTFIGDGGSAFVGR